MHRRILTEDDSVEDSKGVWDVVMGHRHLSTNRSSEVLNHPISNEDHTVWISFDGHVYNRRELRHNLKYRDHRFVSDTGAEFIVHLYEEKGEDFLLYLEGIFALALWDDRRKRLILARDRIGARPMYYTTSDKCLVFASEVKALIAAGMVIPELWPPALAEYFTFQNTFGRETLFKDVRILLPGTLLKIDSKGVSECRWWEHRFHPGKFSKKSMEKCAEELRQVLEEVINAQVPTNVPVGSYLSGGIDSTCIASLAGPAVPGFSTFTCGFDLTHVEDTGMTYDETSDARLIARRYGTRHQEMVLGHNHMARVLPKLITCQEELRLGMTYQNYYAAQLAGSVRVILGGTGGDELFGGYPWRHTPASECQSLEEFNNLYFNTYQRIVAPADRDVLFHPEMRHKIGDYSPWESFTQVFGPEDTKVDFLNRALLFEIRTILHASLTNEDKIHNSLSLDYRVPLVANRITELALSIPANWKLQNGFGKMVFRKAVEDLLPGEIILSKKQGFCPPDCAWMRGPMLPYIREILFSKRTQNRGILNQHYIERIIEEHTRGLMDHRLLIWSFLCFEWWNRVWIDGDVVHGDR